MTTNIEPLSKKHRVIRGEKIVPGGQCLAHFNERPYLIWNCLPGELVQARIVKKRKGIRYAIAEEIIEPHPERLDPKEPDHFLSCSPWQIVPWQLENEWKQEFAESAFHKLDLPGGNIELVTATRPTLHYRNKMEFSFEHTEFKNHDSPLKLALHKRGSYNWKIPIDGCCLAEDVINETANAVVDWLNLHQATHADVKTVIVRSNGTGKSTAALFVKTEQPYFNDPAGLKLPDHCQGLRIYLSNPKSPASVVDKTIYASGDDFLFAELNDVKLKFGLLSFFQVNIPLFDAALGRIGQHLDPRVPSLDFYSGVGAIGLPLANQAKSWHLVDSNAEAINFARENIALNGVKNAQADCAPAEEITDLIKTDQIVVVDPPRAGMNKKVVQKLLAETPQKIIYLSCNMSTQARDVELLVTKYKITDACLFNFFPRTPHVESLLVLERI